VHESGFGPNRRFTAAQRCVCCQGKTRRSATTANTGVPDAFLEEHRAPIILAAAQNNVPAVYYLSDFARDGGLLSYGVDRADLFRRTASYVDRILRGAQRAELPVQLPTKFEMAVNLKTAKALSLTVPLSLLAIADEVIELAHDFAAVRESHRGADLELRADRSRGC
jgi:hypothetical protein